MAKLPRLMQSGPPQYIDPARLADTRDGISGELGIENMQRLLKLVSQRNASIDFSLQFNRDQQHRIRISGQFSCCLTMECQRCLQPVDVEIARSVSVALVADEAGSKALPRGLEPLVVSDKELSLPMFFEDELLLALPLAPNHNTRECQVQSRQSGRAEDERQHPFEVLKELKLKNSND